MPDTIERTIYKLEIDDSGYIKGVDNLSASTKKFSDQQEAANKRLKENEAALKLSAEVVEKNRKALEAYAGADKKYKDQLESNLKTSQASYAKLAELVGNVRKGYEKAKKAAEDFEKTSERATRLQEGTTGGKIVPQAPVIPQVIPSFQDFGLKEILAETNIEFERLRTAIAGAEERMASLNAEDEEFKQLAPIVEKGKIALQQYDDAAKKASGSTLSLRTQIRQGKEELVKLEQAGKGATTQYFELEKRVARLTDEFGDQQERIKVLASDTKLLDFGKAAITSATSAFQAYTAISILAGDESAELQKKTMQLFAAMQLLTSLEQLSNSVKRGSVLATLSQSASQAVYTAVVGASTGALRAFRIALLASTGIGVVIGIGLLVKKYLELKSAAKEAAAESKRLNDVIGEAKGDFTKAVVEVNTLRNSIQLAKDGFIKKTDVVKLYNETIGKTAGEVKTLDEAEQALNKNAEAYIQFTLLKAAANIALGKAAEEAFKIQEKSSTATVGDIGQVRSREIRTQAFLIANQAKTSAKEAGKSQADIELAYKTAYNNALKAGLSKTETVQKESFEKIAKDLQQQAADISKEFGFDFLGGKAGSGAKEIENVYIKNLRDLLARLREASKKEIQNEDLIQSEFVNKLFTEIDRIDELVAKKQLTPKQGGVLVGIIEQIIGKDFDKAIADFRKKVQAAINKLNDELEDIQNKANQDTLNLIQNDFDRRAALIEFNEKKEISDAREATEERLAALELDKLLIGEQAYQDARKIITDTGTQAILTIEQKAALARQDLAADIFKQSLDAFQAGLNQGLIARDEELARLIRSASDKFLTGKITFEQFQKELTAIQRNEESIRRDRTLDNQRSELAALDKQIESTIDKTTKQYADLLKLRDDYRKKLADGEAEDAVKDAQDANEDPDKKKRDSLFEYVSAVGQLADATIAFWQKANEAESAALDRSITLQERRVDAAQRIAERGNAQYLKQEEDRLKEVQLARENAARRELAINAALQASQLLVGITGAISKIATPGIGIAETIGAIATIFAALATGYGLVKSLQGNQPKFAKGKKYVTRDGHPSGTDTIPAWLNEGEAVIPKEKNKAYHPTVAAIYDGTVPAEHLNNFVKTYHKVKPIPQPNYQRIKDAAELHISSDGKMAVLLTEHSSLLKENNELQRQILKKNIRVENKIDRDGVSSMVYDFIEQKRIDRRT